MVLVIRLSVVLLSVVMLSVVMLGVVIRGGIAPFTKLFYSQLKNILEVRVP